MIQREVHGDVVVVRLAHGRASALDVELCDALAAEFAALAGDGPAAVVLTGTGSIYSAGVDLFRLLEEGRDYAERFVPALSRALRAVFEHPLPVVAAVNGHAIAGGCVLVQACDLRIMAAGGARAGVAELAVGVPFPSAPLEIVRYATPAQHFQEVVYTGATMLPEAALAMGLIDEIVDPEALLDRAIERAAALGAIPRASFSHTKALMRRPAVERMDRYGPAADAAATEAWASDELRATIRAYLERTIGKSSL